MSESITLHWIDWSIIISYILFSLGVAYIFQKEQLQALKNIFYLVGHCLGGL